MKSLFTFFVIVCISALAFSQDIDCYNGRFKEKVFSDIEIDFHSEVVYARKLTSAGKWQNLAYDVYLPKDDTMKNRPAVMLAHGGGFIDLFNQKSPDIVKLAREMCALGYVVISVEYREEPSFNSLLSEEKMVKAVGRGLIDIRDATCYIMDTTLNHGNPYGVDPSKVIIGGVSAGAVSFLHAIFLDSLEQMPEQFQEWILEVEPNTNALLADKYCGATVLGMINISGAILDTAWINPENIDEYPAMMHVHGTADPIVPYAHARPFGLQNLPKLMGSKLIDRYARRLGMVSELDTYKGEGHVPIIGVNWNALFSEETLNVMFNPYILRNTLEHMTEFSYNLISCNEKQTDITTGIKNVHLGDLSIYPNPSAGQLFIDLPFQTTDPVQLSITDVTGKIVYRSDIQIGSSQFALRDNLAKGIYQVILKAKGEIFSSKLLVQ